MLRMHGGEMETYRK